MVSDPTITVQVEGADDAVKEIKKIKAATSVDAGWRSRKLIVGVVLGALVILAASALMLVAVTGVWVKPEIAAHLVKLDPKYWVWAIAAALGFVAMCIGLISVDKVLDLVRDALPILKAKYGVKE